MSTNSEDLSENNKKKSFFDWIFENSSEILIFVGIGVRVFILFYCYYIHILDPSRSWGDVGLNFARPVFYPVLTTAFLYILIFLSFGYIEIFAFYAFLWDLLSSITFYFVLKSFNIQNRNFVFGLFLINPFWILNNSFSLTNCGYHITDALFFFFFFLALIYYPKKENYTKYLFYLFLGLSMCIKYYTLLTVPIFFLKYLIEKDWKEMKVFILCIFPLLFFLIIIPYIFLSWYSYESYDYLQHGFDGPIYVRFIPMTLIIFFFVLFRLKKTDHFETSIVSIIAVGTLIFFSFQYLRWFQSLILYGILKEKEFFTFNLKLGIIQKEIHVNNHVLTIFLSFISVILSYIYLITFLRAPSLM